MSNPPAPQAPSGEDPPILPTTPTPQLHRSTSNSSRWSATDTPQHHYQGTSYFSSRPISPTPRQPPILIRNASSSRRGARSTSVSSSQVTSRGAGLLNEEDEESDEEEDAYEEGRDMRGKTAAVDDAGQVDDGDHGTDRSDDPITLKDRQSLINVEHPFGLPIWKPALYKKSRSVTRYADEALHSIPSAQAERHLLPGNIFWVVCFGWWLALTFFVISLVLLFVPKGGRRYSSLVYGLGWYVAWPFGKYVEGELEDENPNAEDEERPRDGDGLLSRGSDDHPARAYAALSNLQTNASRHDDLANSSRGVPLSQHSTITPATYNTHHANTQNAHAQTVSWNSNPSNTETTSLIGSTGFRPVRTMPIKSYGATPFLNSESPSPSFGASEKTVAGDWLGKVMFWLAFISVIAPLLLIVCTFCWALVITIPMAKLNWALIKHLFQRPTSIRFCAAPPAVVISSPHIESTAIDSTDSASPQVLQFAIKHQRLSAGQAAPSSPASTVLLCTYRAVGWQYYKYTVGGVNIMFVNLLPVVIFAILDGFILLPIVDRHKDAGKHVPAILSFLTSRALIFFLSLASVIPLSYFIGMAVASISAQSSIGMGAVINATFGSFIEVILYSIALKEGKGHLVEGSIVGSLLAGVLLMPGMSMCSGALRRKEQKFNAKSAGVTSMMLIMAIIGTLTPTLFYQTYGSFLLTCSGCADRRRGSNVPWVCDHCYYQHPDPVDDPFYQSTVKSLMYFCAAILLFSYLIGLWFSLRTHASQIWQNPQQLLHPIELPIGSGSNRVSLYQRLVPGATSVNPPTSLHRKSSNVANLAPSTPSRSQTPVPRPSDTLSQRQQGSANSQGLPPSPSTTRRVSYAAVPPLQQSGFSPLMESVDHAVKNGLQPMQLSEAMTTDDFTRAVAVATVSALRHQQTQPHSPVRLRTSGMTVGESDGHGGHEAPSWSRTTSASVLLACTALYAAIAEILVDVVDVVMEDSGIDEKFLGITLFALVPNTTEFMNAIAFALNGNIALSMEIGSAYALQVCLLQIPAMVAFSAWYAPDKMGKVSETFTLIFPRWDVIAIILAVFLMTYTYIEAKSNYHRGSILILSYLVLVAGFYYAPQLGDEVEVAQETLESPSQSLSFLQSALVFLSLR